MERVTVFNTNWGMQVVDREMNDVLFALVDEQRGPHRTPKIEAQAKKLAAFYNDHPRPFRENDHAILKPGYPWGDEPIKVRILECKTAYGRCGSGWLVTAARLRGGKRPKFPDVLVKEIDSGWFEPSS